MENITQGHWIFAAVFAVVFIIGISFAYKSDSKTHKMYYKNSYLFMIALILCMFLLFIFKNFMR
jgi:cytochrome bd-type quinol oxidase subunit 1